MIVPDQTIHYDGPTELAEQWSKFAARNSKNGKNSYSIIALNTLNDILFHADGTDAIISWNSNKLLKFDVERLALDLSTHAFEKDTAPLYQAIIGSLATQWVKLETQHGLYPPVPIASHEGVTLKEKDKVLERRQALLQTPQGKFLHDTLLLLCDMPIKRMADMSFHKYRHTISGLDYADILGMAQDRLFTNYLFSYNTESRFTTYIDARLKNDLVRRLEIKAWDMTLLDDETGRDSGVTHSAQLEDKSAPAMDDKHGEQLSIIANTIDSHFPARDSQLLRTRFFNGGKTQEEVGDSLHLSASRISQIETKLMARLKANVQERPFKGNGHAKAALPVMVSGQDALKHGFIGKGMVADELTGEGLFSSRDTMPKTVAAAMDGLGHYLPRNWPIGKVCIAETPQGDVPIVAITGHGRREILGKREPLKDYLRTLPQLQYRHEGYASVHAIADAFHAKHIKIGYELIQKEVLALLDKAPPGHDIGKPVRIAAPYGSVSAYAVVRHNDDAPPTLSSYVKQDDIVSYLTRKYSLKPTVIPKGFIQSAEVTRLLHDSGYKVGHQVVMRAMNQLADMAEIAQASQDYKGNGDDPVPVETSSYKVVTPHGTVELYDANIRRNGKAIEQPYAQKEQIIPYLVSSLKLSPEIGPDMLPAHAYERILREEGYSAREPVIRKIMNDLLMRVPADHPKMERYSVPTDSGPVEVAMSRSSKGISPYAEKTGFLAYLHQHLELHPLKKEGYLGAAPLAEKMRERGYSVYGKAIAEMLRKKLADAPPQEGPVKTVQLNGQPISISVDRRHGVDIVATPTSSIPAIAEELYAHTWPEHYLPLNRCRTYLAKSGYHVNHHELSLAYDEIKSMAEAAHIRSTIKTLPTPHGDISVYLGSTPVGIRPFIKDSDALNYMKARCALKPNCSRISAQHGTHAAAIVNEASDSLAKGRTT